VLYGCADGPAGPTSLEWAGQPVLRAAAGQPTGIGVQRCPGPWTASRQQAAAARMMTIGGITVHPAQGAFEAGSDVSG
jgi:hypothetical protein